LLVLGVKIVGVSLERLVGCRSRDELVVAVRAGDVPKWLMFRGHQSLKNGGVGLGCLSLNPPTRVAR
jgi:hypothetical protein